MKKTFGTQINETASQVRLTNAEKVRMRAMLMAKMRPQSIANDIQEAELKVPATPRKTREYTAPSFGFGWISSMRFVPATLALFGMVGAGVTFASEDAVPGDILYPVKVNISEEVRGALTFGEEAEASWEARRAERRLEEAERLAAEGRLNLETSTAIAGAFERHTDAARESLDRIEEEGSDDGTAVAARSKFETALSAHQVILSHIALGVPGNDTTGAGQVAEKVRAKAEQVAGLRASKGSADTMSLKIGLVAEDVNATGTADAKIAAQTPAGAEVATRIRAAAKEQIASTKSTFNSLGGTFDEDARTRIDTEINAVAKLFADGEVALAAGETAEAVEDFERALARARKAELFMQAETRLNVNLFRSGVIFFDTPAVDDDHTTTTESKDEDAETESD